MKTIVTITYAMLFLFLACNSSKPTKADANNHNGEQIYKEYCTGCHGSQLENLLNSDWKKGKSLESISSMIQNGIYEKGMPGFGESLSNSEIEAVAKYMLDFVPQERGDSQNQPDEINYEVIVDGLEIPWGMEFLPNGDFLVAERQGKLYRYSTTKELQEITGLPPIRAKGQGGLMDLKLHPDYNENGWLYISYSYIDESSPKKGNTAIIRAKLNGNELVEQETIYRGMPAINTSHHFGSRMVFDREGYLYFTIGDRGKRDVFPQKIDNSNGKVHRLNDDGSIPQDNPFVDMAGAETSIYSYGHRNPQGIAMHPVTGEIWESEHGPKGGDEINVIQKGENYGWPVISYGINYSGTKFTELTHKEGMVQPNYYYVPSIAPCGMTFISTDKYGEEWQNSILIGSLSFRYLEFIKFDENKQVVLREKLLENLDSRVRDVREGPDDFIYVALENPGRIIRLLPE